MPAEPAFLLNAGTSGKPPIGKVLIFKGCKNKFHNISSAKLISGLPHSGACIGNHDFQVLCVQIHRGNALNCIAPFALYLRSAGGL
ncbi:hypothetical protein V5F77_17560, partial [Xanthobacter sp. DSM 24535]|uniref:hypothetical protein n=1 Tax=Roseixanthobacter psychrophilus TaxID=3119917 RepID=UPI003726B2C2